MNDKDMNNILYILNRSQEELDIWWHNMDEEDREYAMWIIKAYREELVRMQDAYEELHKMDAEDLSIAKNYLKKFQL
jgi:hypothetical protein